jgi:hypothetical protein
VSGGINDDAVEAADDHDHDDLDESVHDYSDDSNDTAACSYEQKHSDIAGHSVPQVMPPPAHCFDSLLHNSTSIVVVANLDLEPDYHCPHDQNF